MMKNSLLALVLIALCSCASKPEENRVTFERSYSSPVHLTQSITNSVLFSEQYTDEFVFVVDPKSYDRVRGTMQAYRPKVTFNYLIKPESDQRFVIEYSGLVEYLSTLKITSVNTQQTISGVVEGKRVLSANRVEGSYGEKLKIPFPDGINAELVISK